MSSQYLTYQNKLIRIVQEKSNSPKEININIQLINIKKNDLSQPQPHLIYSKTINKKGYFEIVGFEKGLDHIIKSKSIQFEGRVDSFIKLSTVALIYDIIQCQYNIYLLVQVSSSDEAKLEFILGYYILDIDSSSGSNFKIINRFQLPVETPSSYTHKILDGPNVISFKNNNNNNINSIFYIQSVDLNNSSSSNESLKEYKWVSYDYKSISDSTPILYYTANQNNNNSNNNEINQNYSSNNIFYDNMVPIIITYSSKPSSIFEKIVLSKENILNQNRIKTTFNKSLILNNLSTKKESFKPNEIQIIKTLASNYFGILLDSTVLIYKEDDDKLPVWELKLKKKPSNIYFVNLPLIFDPFEEENATAGDNDDIGNIDNKFNWSQGCLVVNYQKDDELVQVYSIASKLLLNEITKVQEIWIHDFLSYGFDQLLIRHIPPAQKAITLSMIPLHYTLNFNRINLNDIADTAVNYKNNNRDNSKDKKSVSFNTIMESLENMSKLAKSEYSILEQQLKSKESLLNYSLQILESLGIPNSSYGQQFQQQNQLNDWNFKLVSIFNNNNSNNDSNNKDIDLNNNINNNSLKPSLLSKTISIKDGILYCQLEFNKPTKPFNLVSVFLSSREVSLFTKLKYTISNSNSNYGIVISSSSTTIILESSLKDLDLDYYSLNLINIVIEWAFINSIENNDLNYNSSNSIFSAYLDSFYLNDYLTNKDKSNSRISNNSRALDNYPFSLDFDIVGVDLSNLLNKFEIIFPKNQFKINNLSGTDIEFYDLDSANSNNSNIIIHSTNNNSNGNNISFTEFIFNIKSRKLITFKINSMFFFNLLNHLKLLIDNLPNGINLYLSNQNEWSSKLKLDICNQLKQAFEIVINEENLSNSLTLNKKEQKNAFIKFHNLYQKVFQSLIETQSLLYNLDVLNKFGYN